MKHAHIFDRKIKGYEDKLAELERLRRIKIGEILEIRKFRKGLEKLRAKVKAEFIRQQDKQEQKEMDDNTNMRFARNLLQSTV